MIDILGSIDAKIENSNAIIDNLLKNLQLQYALRFLNRDDLPRVPLLQFVENTLGGDWGKEQAEKNFSEEVVCIRGADIPDISSGQNGKPPRRFILKKNLEAKQLSDYEIIVEISGGSPTQSTGRSALITQHLINQYNVPLICTNFCRAIRCKNKVFAAYVYSAFSQMYNDDLFFNYENGTTGIKNLDLQAILESEEIALPSEDELNAFFTLTNDTLIQVMRYREENNKLNELKQLYLKKFFG